MHAWVCPKKVCVSEGEKVFFRCGTSVPICRWLKGVGLHGAAAKTQSRSGRPKAQVLTQGLGNQTHGVTGNPSGKSQLAMSLQGDEPVLALLN